MIDNLEHLITAGPVILLLARRLEAKGRTEEARKLYLRAIDHGQVVAKLRQGSNEPSLTNTSVSAANLSDQLRSSRQSNSK